MKSRAGEIFITSRRSTVQSDQLWVLWLVLIRRKNMRKEVRVQAFGGVRHEAAEKFFRFVRKNDFRSGGDGARRVVLQPKEVQLEFSAMAG